MRQKLSVLAPSDDIKLGIRILDATFYHSIRDAPLLLAHANVLAMKLKAHHPVTYTQIKIFTENSGSHQVSIHNAFLPPIHERIFIALVKNTAFVGSASTNPFHFHDYMKNLVLYVNGVQHTSEQITFDCSSTFGATRANETPFSSRVFITMTVLT